MISCESENEKIAKFIEHCDVIKGVMRIATFDMQTCLVCAAYDGLKWDLSLKPIGNHNLPFKYNYELHHGCRCALVPIMKTMEDLGFGSNLNSDRMRAELDNKSTRSSEIGQVPKTTTFEEFIKLRGFDFQINILGETRYNLWKKKKLSLIEFLDANGDLLDDIALIAIFGLT